MIAAVNMRYHKTTHKFGLLVLKNVAECEAIDKENGNTLWMDAVKKEMEAVANRLQDHRRKRTTSRVSRDTMSPHLHHQNGRF